MATGISWTDETLNFLAGCSKISAGCRNCYAISMAHRLPAMAKALAAQGKATGRLAAYEGLTREAAGGIDWTGEVHFIPEALEQPFKWKKPRKIFVNSMSDCFHSEVKDEWLLQFFAVAEKTPQHIYQILTKRPQRMLDFFESMEMTPPDNVWLGVTVENQQTADERIPLLLQTPAAVRFLSCEPLLESLDIGEAIATAFCTKCHASFDDGDWNEERELEECPTCGQSSIMDYQFTTHSNKINWVIIGGESSPGARPCNADWIRSLVQQCKAAGVAAWVKQMGSKTSLPGITGKGADPSEWPEDLRVQEFPIN